MDLSKNPKFFHVFNRCVERIAIIEGKNESAIDEAKLYKVFMKIARETHAMRAEMLSTGHDESKRLVAEMMRWTYPLMFAAALFFGSLVASLFGFNIPLAVRLIIQGVGFILLAVGLYFGHKARDEFRQWDRTMAWTRCVTEEIAGLELEDEKMQKFIDEVAPVKNEAYMGSVDDGVI